MIFSEKTRIEDYIIEILDISPQEGPSIFKKINLIGFLVSKQALYKSLRKLLAQEVINKAGSFYSLNRIWLQKVHNFSKRHISEQQSHDVIDILNFEDGDSVQYNFKNPFTLDITWGASL